MTRNEAIEKAAIDVANDLEAELNAKYPASVREFPCMQKDFDGDMQSVIALRAALALPEDSKVVNAELYGLAVALADFRANQLAKVSSDQIMRESKSCKDALRYVSLRKDALRYLSLREASGEPMPYRVVRDGDKVRFDVPAQPKDGE